MMEAAVKTKPDFVALYGHFDTLKKRVSGLEAEIKKAITPDALAEIPSFYRLMVGTGTHAGWQRIAFFLPYVKHKEGADSIGKQLAKGGVSEMRLFQVIRSDSPNDIIQLRRLVQQIEPALDWRSFGATIFYWDYSNPEKGIDQKQNKRRILEDYFLASDKK
ncbi:MAG: type I-E CRISPR-associated protein Cse2/CasB [Thiotrichaceae bacterium]|nr:type I-E CRISPR-associated protein Cse2/CasB [Thiotrichaceae bacterium]